MPGFHPRLWGKFQQLEAGSHEGALWGSSRHLWHLLGSCLPSEETICDSQGRGHLPGKVKAHFAAQLQWQLGDFELDILGKEQEQRRWGRQAASWGALPLSEQTAAFQGCTVWTDHTQLKSPMMDESLWVEVDELKLSVLTWRAANTFSHSFIATMMKWNSVDYESSPSLQLYHCQCPSTSTHYRHSLLPGAVALQRVSWIVPRRVTHTEARLTKARNDAHLQLTQHKSQKGACFFP